MSLKELWKGSLSLRRGVTVLQLTKGLGVIEVGIKVPEVVVRNEQRAAAIRPGITWLLARYDEILRMEKKSFCSLYFGV
jgi:hypothetical protein